MAVWRFNCASCADNVVSKLGDTQEQAAAKLPPACPKCGGAFERFVKPPTSHAMEKLDNGWMARAVERPVDAERLYKERADKDPSKG